jgi:DNA-binding response OmpR family regulator
LGAGVPNPKVPVIILTGYSDEEHIRRSVELGINDFIVKPVSLNALDSKISAALTAPQIDSNRLKKDWPDEPTGRSESKFRGPEFLMVPSG